MTLRLTFPLGQRGASIPGAPGAESERMTCVLSIAEFARASGLTAKALRLYDELELLTPAEVDQSNGYRYYAPEQVEQARLVARLRFRASRRSLGLPPRRPRQTRCCPTGATLRPTGRRPAMSSLLSLPFSEDRTTR